MIAFASPGWTPSPARTIAIPAPLPQRGVLTAALPLAWPAKPSSDCLDYVIDPTAWLAEVDDGLAGASVSAPAPASLTDLQVVWCSIISGLVVALVGGGVPGGSVPLLIVLTTIAGRRHLLQVTMPITNDGIATAAELAPQLQLPGIPGATVPIAPNAMRLPDGSILTGPTGLPYLLA